MKRLAILLMMLVLSLAMAQKPVQLDIYNSGQGYGFVAGGAFGYLLHDLAPDLGTAEHFPVYGRFSAASGSANTRLTLGADAMSPWFFGLFRVQAGAGLELDDFGDNPVALGPYLRLGSQVWLFFGDVDFSPNATHFEAGIRLEF